MTLPDANCLILVGEVLSISPVVIVALHGVGGGPEEVLSAARGSQIGIVARILRHLWRTTQR